MLLWNSRNAEASSACSLLLGLLLLLAAGSLSTAPAASAGEFATSATGFVPGPGASTDVSLALGGPRGNGDSFGGTHTLTLGVGGRVTFAFDRYLANGPGADLIVFENAFFLGGDPTRSFAELGFVEVSTDGVRFARFPARSLTPGPVGGFGTVDPAHLENLAGAQPVYANVETNGLDPFDPSVAGGDAFDLDDLVGDPLVTSGLLDLMAVRFVRILDIPGDGSVVDSFGNPIYDATTSAGTSNSIDIDAVAVIHAGGIVAAEKTSFGRVKALYAGANR